MSEVARRLNVKPGTLYGPGRGDGNHRPYRDPLYNYFPTNLRPRHKGYSDAPELPLEE